MTTAIAPTRSLSELEIMAEQLMRATLSKNTWRQYRVSCRHFSDWCATHGLGPLPASPSTLCLYLTHCAEVYSVATINARLAAIATAHTSMGYTNPCQYEQVKRLWKGIKRAKGVASQQKTALVTEHIAAIVGALPNTLKAKRDRALILVGFAGAFRRGELVSLQVSDIKFTKQGLVVTLPRSKTDQEQAGYVKGLPYGKNPDTCPVRALRAWLDAAGVTAGPIWRSMRHGLVQRHPIGDRDVARLIKALAAAAGLEGDYSGLSLRAGFATSAVEAGLSVPNIMRQTGHKQATTLMRYVRHVNVWHENPAEGVGL